MFVASLENCQRLFELKPEWDDSDYWRVRQPNGSWDMFTAENALVKGIPEGSENDWCPAYNSGYLLRKLQSYQTITLQNRGSKKWYAVRYTGQEATADTPEDAVCKLAIALAQNPKTEKE